ncbi:MAG TPA: potassium-transporting ATPase subunit F [Rhizomicrobium sp.]|jgi:K+-transporting ATPase KdpF subunit|nr:potassium-transporting ATPase subunit F [Rhizomicrobium sp.]
MRPIMLFDYILGGIFALGILAYLVVALARPEKF